MIIRRTASAALGCAAALFALQGCKAKAESPPPTTTQAKHEELRKLTVDEVEAGIQNKDLAVFDNNSKGRYASGHVPTAKWLDHKNVAASDLPSDKGQRMVFYCSNEH
jgi:hypothetical protein